tara:strand:- start:741 stop:1070 length:330 start_codon:yes stop_codon:yes gene_type:complete
VSKYDEMSDAKIDHLVKGAQYGHNDKDINRLFHGGRMSFCSNPNDAWPIIVDNEISLIKDIESNFWSARSDAVERPYESMDCGFEFDSKKPLRAAMIVFLMMKDSEQCN